MVVTFACPECGTSIELAPNAVGRKARCAECLTLVEVPYFPRQSRTRRGSDARQWMWVGIAAASAVLCVLIFYMIITARIREGDRRAYDELVRAATADESNGKLDVALNRIDAALGLGKRTHVATSEEQEALTLRRERLAAAAARDDARRRLQTAEAKHAAAQEIARNPSGNMTQAVALCEEAVEAIDGLSDEEARQRVSLVRKLAASLIGRRGVVLEPINGSFLPGMATAEIFADALHPIVAQFLTSHGYIVKRDKSPLTQLWDNSPFHITTSVTETFGTTYLNSVLRTTRIDVTFRLSRSAQEVWNSKLTAHTRVSSSRFSAFESGYLAAATKRTADGEKRLHDDALASAVELLPGKLVTIPDWKSESGSRY